MKALITGITGQDGSYMAELLLEKGYEVYGLVRRSSTDTLERIQHIIDKIHIINGDMTDQTSLNVAMRETMPDEVYNFAAQGFVPVSWQEPEHTSSVNALGTIRLLEAIRATGKNIRMLHASTSEIFGDVATSPQDESTQLNPRNPYGFAKLFSHAAVTSYRKKYGIFACNAINYNHESPRRGPEFVSRKITDAVARIKTGKLKHLTLGSLDGKRDWGYAGDFVQAYHSMLQNKQPDDFVVATGILHSVQDMVREAFSAAGIKEWEKHVKTDKNFVRPPEAVSLVGNISKIKRELGWKPQTSFKEMMQMMVKADIERHAEA